MAARSSVVFPEPLGPMRIVGAPAEKVIETHSRTVTLPARIPTSENLMGKSDACVRTLILRSVRWRGARPMPGR
jgi:hypothetical protein